MNQAWKPFSQTAVALLLTVGLATAQSGAAASSQSSPSATSLTGVVSDTMCGAKHMYPDKTKAECTRQCVTQGSKLALVLGKKVYTLQGHEAELDTLAGQRVTVTGAVNGDTLSVHSVVPVKKRGKS